MGYTAVPNEILEVQSKMSDPECRVTLALLRLTIGHQAVECTANYDTLEEMTGLSRGGVASGVSAVNARGFFERFGRSGWRFLVHTVDQNSLPDRLNGSGNSLPVRLNQSTSQTESVYPVDQNTPILKKRENNKEIYIPPQEIPNEATPFPEQEDAISEMVSCLSQVVKDVFSIRGNEQKFREAAVDLIGREISQEQVRAFPGYWKDNGYYKGKPALTSLVQEIENSINGVRAINKNGLSHRSCWLEVEREIKKNGRRSTKKWEGATARVIRKCGGYSVLCNKDFPEAERAFKIAFNDLEIA